MQTTTTLTDRAYDILRSEHQPLDAIFMPRTIALIGATEKAGSVGRTVLWNLITHPFGGTVFPVNPHRSSVLGIKAYPTVAAIPEAIDLAIIATPAATVPDLVQQCVDAGVKGAIVLSAGFKEIGAAGAALEQQVLDQLHRSKLRLIGPNCLGIMNPHLGLNATFTSTMALPGNVGFISQSGALCSAILDWSLRTHVGFSAFISIGSMLDVNWGDLIYYLGDDPHTQSIVIYMESIGDARSFLSAAREVALTKPIIVIKAGRTTAAAKAAMSHTGALAGSDAVFDAALRRCGVLRVDRIADLFNMADVLSKQPRPKGPHLTIVTNAGGPGVLATDALLTTGGHLTELSSDTIDALNQVLPAHWSHSNPIDILGDADPDRYAKTLEIVTRDPHSDGILVILTPQAMTNPSLTAKQLRGFAQIGQPILASWMGDADVEAGTDLLNQANIPTFTYPDTAARVFNYMWRYSDNLRSLYETPVLTEECNISHRDQAAIILRNVQLTGRSLLTELESKQLLAAYGIPTIETYVATDVEQAVQLAEAMGYPVVLKVHSETITHKTDVGGVQLNLQNAAEVRQAYATIATAVQSIAPDHFLGVTVQPMVSMKGYELIIGSSLDPQFGPVILFGAGGQLVEVFHDRALGLPPLNTTLARRLMEQTQIYQALKGVRGRPSVDLAALEQLLVRFSQLIAEQPWIREIDINPLLVQPLSSQSQAATSDSPSLMALDARVVLHSLQDVMNKTTEHLPDFMDYSRTDGLDRPALPKLAICPYPSQYISPWTTRQGTPLTIRPIRPEDEPAMIQFHKTLSEQSVYFRYFHLIKLSQRIAHERLTRLCFIDYDREMALVADYYNPQTDSHEILAVARLSKLHGANTAEFALLVSDRYQCQGLGTELLGKLVQVGRDEHLEAIHAEILSDNHGMQRTCSKLGFQISRTADPSIVHAQIKL